jgi:hypothetical protein
MSPESPAIGSKLSCRAVRSDSYPQARPSDAQTFHTEQSQQAGRPDRNLGIVRDATASQFELLACAINIKTFVYILTLQRIQ